MFDVNNFDLSQVEDVSPDAIPVNQDVLVELIQVDPWQYEGNWQLGLKFKLDQSVPSPFGGRVHDKNFKVSGASKDNVYWMKQFFFDMGVPKEVVNSWKNVPAIVQGLRQYVGRKYVVRPTRNNRGFINVNTIRPFQPVQTAQTLPTAGAPAQAATLPAAAPAAPAAPAATPDPWANQAPAPAAPAQAPQQAPAPAQAPAADPWAQAAQAAQAPAQQDPTAAAGATAGPPVNTETAPAPATPDAAPAETSNTEDALRALISNV